MTFYRSSNGKEADGPDCRAQDAYGPHWERCTPSFVTFEDLGEAIECLRVGGDIAGLRPKSHIGRRFITHCINGRAAAEALFLVCREPDSDLGRVIFGAIRPTYDDKTQDLTASGRGSSLRVAIAPFSRLHGSGAPRSPNTLVVATDFRSFSLWRADEAGLLSTPFAVLHVGELCDIIAFTGSLWESIYPSHYAIVSRTIAYTFAQNIEGTLFSPNRSVRNDCDAESEAYRCLLQTFHSADFDLLSLDAFHAILQHTPRPPRLLSDHSEGRYIVRRYSPQRSSVFDFGEPPGQLTRGDFVATYRAGNTEFHREFFLAPQTFKPVDTELLLAAFDILHMLAIRRAKLFRTAFASRVYNVLLPPLVLMSGALDEYVVFPCLNLYRTSRQGFRRTLGMTFITCPVQILWNEARATGFTARPANLEELYQLKDGLLSPLTGTAGLNRAKSYTLDGPLVSCLKLPSECTIPEAVRAISGELLRCALAFTHIDQLRLDDLVNSAQFTSNQESRIATMLLLVNWASPAGFTKPWERWISTGADSGFQHALFRTLFYRDYIEPHSAEASRHAVQFKEFNIGNTLGADMGGMTLYNPQETLKFVLYPKDRERYPNYSIVRWMAWQIYIDSALAALRALIYRFHPVLEARGDLHSIIGTLDEMMQEFVDFYDLDIKDYFYRREYEKLRSLMQVDSDYNQLLGKFASAKEDESLREQRLINKLLVALTIATVTVTIVSTLAQMGALAVPSYLLITLALSPITVWVGYILFDPCRHRYSRWSPVVLESVYTRYARWRTVGLARLRLFWEKWDSMV